MAAIQQVSYFRANLQDKPGELLKVMQALKSKNIGLAGLWGFATSPGKAQLYAVAKNPAKLRGFWRASRLLAEEGKGFFITGNDRTGALNATLESLAKNGINIVAVDAIAVGGKFGSFIWVKPADVKKAAKVLGK
ncbi:MAG TPA: hypothetical protein VNJ07_02940 [Chitinophagales bacterium]|nr:hypothetical protein [Chitinophagales bacterium]